MTQDETVPKREQTLQKIVQIAQNETDATEYEIKFLLALELASDDRDFYGVDFVIGESREEYDSRTEEVRRYVEGVLSNSDEFFAEQDFVYQEFESDASIYLQRYSE